MSKKLKSLKIEFDFVIVRGSEEPVIPKGWIEISRLLPGGDSFGVADDETVVLILPAEVARAALPADLECEKNRAIQGVLLGRLARRLGSPGS